MQRSSKSGKKPEIAHAHNLNQSSQSNSIHSVSSYSSSSSKHSEATSSQSRSHTSASSSSASHSRSSGCRTCGQSDCDCPVTGFCTDDAKPTVDISIFQYFSGVNSTLSELISPNSLGSSFFAGQNAYIAARNIDLEKFLLEQQEAANYMITRFAMPSDYILVPIDGNGSGLSGTVLAVFQKLGSPLYLINYPDPANPGTQLTWGFYRPVVDGKNMKVMCAPSLDGFNFKQALKVTHQFFFYPEANAPPVSSVPQAGINSVEHDSAYISQSLQVNPQTMSNIPNSFLYGLALAEFGYVQLYCDMFDPAHSFPTQFALIKYRFQYALQSWYSTSPSSGTQKEYSVVGSVSCDAASCDFSNGSWNGIMTLLDSFQVFEVFANACHGQEYQVNDIQSMVISFPCSLLNGARIYRCQ